MRSFMTSEASRIFPNGRKPKSCLQKASAPVEVLYRVKFSARSDAMIGLLGLRFMSDAIEGSELILKERRSLETALADLVEKYNRSSYKSPELARMIRQLKA